MTISLSKITALEAALEYLLKATDKTSMSLSKSFAADSSIRIGNLDIPVELATDPIAGLSGRDSLIPGTGMLFHLDGHPVITMQGMKFPLDLVWMAGGRVVDLTENALVPVLDQETLYIPEAHATDVLEINGGEVQRLGIKIGDFVTDSNHILWKQAGEKIYNPSGAHQGPRGGRYDIAGEGGEDESAPEEAPQQDPFAEAQEGGDVDWTAEDVLKQVADFGGIIGPAGEFVDAPDEIKEQVGFVDEEEDEDDPQWEAWAQYGAEHGAAKDQGWDGEEPEYEVEDFDEEGNFIGTQIQSADKVKEYAQGEQAVTGIPLVSKLGEPIDEIYDFHGLGDEDPVTLDHIKSYVASQQSPNLSKLLVLEAALEHLFKIKPGEVPEYGDAPPNTPAYKGKRGGSFYYPSEVGTFTSVDDAAEEDIPIGEEIEREVVAAQDAGGMVPWKAYAEMLPSITKEEVSTQLQDGKREGWSGLRDTTPVTPGVVMRDDDGNITNISTPDGHMISVKEIDPKEPDRGGKSGLVIARTADAEVQAQWVDSQGHTQGTYSFEHNKTAKGKKAAQVAQLVEVLPKLEKALKRDIKDPKPLGKMRLNTIREAAFTIALIHDTFRRVGGPEGATLITMDGQDGRPKKIGKDGKPVRERVKTYGITTMLGKHVKVAGNKVTLDFLGKRGIRNVVTVSDSSLSRELIRRKKEGGPNDTILNISEVAVNNYLKRVSGRDITAKNFRTYHGTRLGLEALEAVGETPSIKKSTFEVDMTKLVSKIQNKGGKDLTADEWRDAIELYVIDAHNRFKLNLIGEPVSKRLGNQPNVALKDYISETIFEQDWDPSFSTEMEKLLEIPRFSAKKIASVQAKIKEQVAKARRKKQK